MSNAGQVYKVAAKEVGYREGKNNNNKYAKVVGLANNQAWCETFQSYLFHQAGLKSLAPVTASCGTAYKWFKAKGRTSEYPALGAQVFYGPGGGSHVGFAYKYDETYVYTIEGNTNDDGSAEGNGVYRKRRVRRDTYVFGYGIPHYTEGTKSADPHIKIAGVKYAKTASL